MRSLKKSIDKIEGQFDQRAERLAYHHPALAFLSVLLGTPALVLGAVFFFTCLVSLPLSLLFGWR